MEPTKLHIGIYNGHETVTFGNLINSKTVMYEIKYDIPVTNVEQIAGFLFEHSSFFQSSYRNSYLRWLRHNNWTHIYSVTSHYLWSAKDLAF